jgi:aspartyl-tRNA(Asn)/glutamyl-tRNA(Gln) amidotransferase subunit C
MVDKTDVERVAENARINLSEDEKQQFVDEFNEVLDKFDKLQEIETEDVEPAFHPVEIEAETREDEKKECLSHEQVFSNTENVEDNQFKGPSA